MPSALATREKGVPIVNISQVFQRSGMQLTCRKDSGVKTPKDFKGRTLGVWFYGNEYPFLSWMDKLGYKTTGGPDGVTVLKQGFNVDPLLQKQADCISTMTYNEYWQLIEAGHEAGSAASSSSTRTRAWPRSRTACTRRRSRSPIAKMADKLARFLKASLKGWDYAIKNQDEAVKIVLENDASGAQTKQHQTTQIMEIAKLVEGGKLGYLEPKSYDRTVTTLLTRQVGSGDQQEARRARGLTRSGKWRRSKSARRKPSRRGAEAQELGI